MVEQAMKEVGHERRDLSVKIVAWSALGLVVAAVLIGFSVAGLYKLFETQHPSPDAPSRIAFKTRMIAPPPQLQNNPQVDLADFEAAETKQLNSYGWADQQGGVAHIPIGRAMDLIVQRGLPTRGPGTNNASGITPEQLQQQKAAATAPKP